MRDATLNFLCSAREELINNLDRECAKLYDEAIKNTDTIIGDKLAVMFDNFKHSTTDSTGSALWFMLKVETPSEYRKRVSEDISSDTLKSDIQKQIRMVDYYNNIHPRKPMVYVNSLCAFYEDIEHEFYSLGISSSKTDCGYVRFSIPVKDFEDMLRTFDEEKTGQAK